MYFYTYWTTAALLQVLALFVLNEVLKHLFELDYKQRWWFRFVLPVASLLIAAIFVPQPLQPYVGPISNAVFSFDLGIHCLEAFILLLLLILDNVLMATKSRYDFGVVAGLGISASVNILAALVRFHFGSRYEVVLFYAPPIGFTLATLIWLRAFLRKPAAQERLPITLHELAELLQKRADFVQNVFRNRKRR